MHPAAIQQMAQEIEALLADRMKLRGRGLSTKLRRAGRRLPRKVRAAGFLLVEASEKARNPRLMGQIDMGAVADAYALCQRHLATIDPTARRRNLIGSMIGSVGFGVLGLVIGLVFLLAWRWPGLG